MLARRGSDPAIGLDSDFTSTWRHHHHRSYSVHFKDSNSPDFTCPHRSEEYMEALHPPSPSEFERIAHVQEEREEELRRKAKEERLRSVQQRRDEEPPLVGQDKRARVHAARLIQRTFRGYQTRRELKGFELNPTTRWLAAVREAQFRQTTLPKPRSRPVTSAGDLEPLPATQLSPARQNWRKVSLITRRAGHDELDSATSSSSSSDSDATPSQRAEARRLRQEAIATRKQSAHMMGLPYFLEMVDQKHRYGSNLRTYHEVWKKSNTDENYFYWLDYGEGRAVDLDTCPRERLDRERVRYLSREERQNYLVHVDEEGRLCWAKNKARIDTTEEYKDSIHGIVPMDDPSPAFNPAASLHSRDSDSSSSEESEKEADRAAKYATPGFDNSSKVRKMRHLSAGVVFDKLLRKSVRKNTWIFVADTSFHLFVGIKASGSFQHSSFLQGSRISAAGLIKVKNGRLRSLSPLSGHYRPPSSSFRAFVASLREAGVDMSRVSISKSYGVLVGLEMYMNTRRKGKEALGKVLHRKDRVVRPEEVRRREEEEKDKSQSAEREREVLRREREDKAAEGTLKRLHIKKGPIEAGTEGEVAQVRGVHT